MASISDLDIGFVGISTIIVASVVGVIKAVSYLVRKRNEDARTRQRYYFGVMEKLSSESPAERLSAAIRLRSVFDRKHDSESSLRRQVLDVYASFLRILPVGVFQKTVGDSLAYASDLRYVDLQKANLQDLTIKPVKSIGNEEPPQVDMSYVDMFHADLSFSVFENVKFNYAVFYNAILYRTHFKKCQFVGSIFHSADLNGVRFTDCKMDAGIVEGPLAGLGLVPGRLPGTYSTPSLATTGGKTIFFSMPGQLTPQDSAVTEAYYDYLANKCGFNVLYYTADHYPEYGQLGKVRTAVDQADGMVAFGMKQIHIEKGTYRPGMEPGNDTLDDKWLPTPWNDIEVGMGLMKRIPILLVKDDEVNTGAFDDKLSECFVSVVSAQSDLKELESSLAFREWLKNVK